MKTQLASETVRGCSTYQCTAPAKYVRTVRGTGRMKYLAFYPTCEACNDRISKLKPSPGSEVVSVRKL